MSIVRLRNGAFGCITNDAIVELQCNDYRETVAGVCYHLWSVGAPQNFMASDVHDITNYCLLLPKLIRTGLPVAGCEPLFTVIDSEWRDIHSDKTMNFPKYPDAEYL